MSPASNGPATRLPPLHVVQIGFLLDRQERTPAQILKDWWPLVDTADMVARTGARVTVLQACAQSATIRREAVTYHFLSPDRGLSTLATLPSFAQWLAHLKADVFHVHGLGFPAEVIALSRLAPHTPILLQDHAGAVPAIWRRRRHRQGMAVAAGVAFCALEQAQPFLRTSILQPHTALFEIPECSSRFAPGDRSTARRLTGVHGNPAVLWVGHLNANKDPLTVLAGISAAVERLPQLQLWCCFGQTPLLAEVQRRIARDSRLSGRVHLLGNVPHGRIETLMQASDLFVLGSQREGSGCSVIEALACGLPPVITAIPSFRALTGEGRVGALWPCGDANALAAALLSTALLPSHEARAATRAHFDRELSFDAAGVKFLSAYQALREGHRRRGLSHDGYRMTPRSRAVPGE